MGKAAAKHKAQHIDCKRKLKIVKVKQMLIEAAIDQVETSTFSSYIIDSIKI